MVTERSSARSCSIRFIRRRSGTNAAACGRKCRRSLFVAEVDGSVVAFAACRISGTEGELMDNAVDQGYTGRGIGSSLHRYVLNYLRMHGCTRAVVRTGLDAAPCACAPRV
ncbi:MAG: GNAT family N-acetyltransferase [Acutalibacteraceae bacterium]